MPLLTQVLLRSELLAWLTCRVAASEDEACAQLAQRLGCPDGTDFRATLRGACHALAADGLIDMHAQQWRIVRLRDAGDSPEELPPGSAPYYSQAASVNVRANKYERDRAARKACLEHHGARCAVCDFDFSETYGALGLGCVRVHHIVVPAAISPGYKLDPVRDLRPVCANCHYMIHRVEPHYSIEQMRDLLARQRTQAA